MRPAMDAQTPNHWTTREVPQGEDFEEREGTGWMTRSLGSACVYKAPSGVQQRSLLCGGRVGGELKTPKTRVEKWSGQSRMWVLLRREETRRSSGAGSGGGLSSGEGLQYTCRFGNPSSSPWRLSQEGGKKGGGRGLSPGRKQGCHGL